MLEILESGITKTFIVFLLCVSAVILFIILHNGSAEDAQTRTFYGIDKYILPLIAIAALPHIYIAWVMIENGFLPLFIFNAAAMLLLWIMGKYGVIGGADAICMILFAFCFPCVVPLVALTVFTLGIERIMRWYSPSLDAEWRAGKTPLLVPMKWGYVCTLPVAAVFLIFVII